MKQKKISHVHWQVAEVAKAAAEELYDNLMGDNLLYDQWKKKHPGASVKGLRKAFVERNWGRCIPIARATMATLLRSPTIDENAKEQIMEALELDSSLIYGRDNPKVQMN